MIYQVIQKWIFYSLFLTSFILCQCEYKSLLFQKVKEVLNSNEFSNENNFEKGPIFRVILPKNKTNRVGTNEFYFEYKEHSDDDKFYLVTPNPPYNDIPGNCLFRKLSSITVTNITFKTFLITSCYKLEFVKVTSRNVKLNERPILFVEHQNGAVKIILHLMIITKIIMPVNNQFRFKRSSGSNRCSLYPLQVDLSTLYARQYTVGGIVQIGNCQGDCSNEIHLLTFHARVRLLMKQRHGLANSVNISPGHCGPDKYKSHKIMYIEPENEQMHIIMEIKDLVVESCNCH